MPNCRICNAVFTDVSSFSRYCAAHRCTRMGCDFPVYDAKTKLCRGHSGICSITTCTRPERLRPGQMYCSRCVLLKQRDHHDKHTHGRAHYEAKREKELKEQSYGATVRQRAELFRERMAKTKTTKEHMEIIIAALQDICERKAFHDILDNLVGWKNKIAWLRWAGRALEPTMMKKDRMTSLAAALEPYRIAYSQSHKYFAERIIEELIIICNLEADKADVKYVIDVAFLAFGGFLAPFTHAASTAVGGGLAGTAVSGATSLGRNLVQMGLTAGANALATDSIRGTGMSAHVEAKDAAFGETFDWDSVSTRGRSTAVSKTVQPMTPAPVVEIGESKEAKATPEDKYHYSVNPMQFTVSLFKYLTTKPRNLYTRTDHIIMEEFGGYVTMLKLYNVIKHPPVD